MSEITIHGIDGIADILERVAALPMTRDHGKCVVARVNVLKPEKASAIYMRVSSSKQAAKGKGSLPEQFRSTWEEIERRGGQVVTVYVDVCTAANRNRLAFKSLLEDVEADKIAILGCWHSSRLVRTQIAAGEIEEAIEHLGKSIELFAVTDTLNADILGILAWAGRWERKAFRERSLMGRQNVLAQGRAPSSTPPFWIQVERDEGGLPIYSLRPIAEHVKWFAEAYAEGMGSTEIVKKLNAERVPRATGQTKYGWTRQYLAQVLKYSALKGQWGPFWGQYVDVPPLISEATWDAIQEKLKENGSHSGRPAQHFVALRGMLWCGECGQKMATHARDWDYVYHTLKDGTRTRYRAEKGHLKVKYVCGGQQHYGFKCRKPEYVLDKILFPRVWAKLCEALSLRTLLLAGLQSRLIALESANEVDELKRIETRLNKVYQRELSYAEQRAEGTINKDVHAELMLRLREERKELSDERETLSMRVQIINEARKQLDTAQLLIDALPHILDEVSRQEQEQLIMALIERIELDKDNQVTITLRLDAAAIREIPNHPSATSPQPELPPATDFPLVLSDNSTQPSRVQQQPQVTAARHRRSMGYRPG